MEAGDMLPLTGALTAATTGITGLLLYKLLRRKPPVHVTVNCWFCNQNTMVPYGNRNCWDCPNCEQYNGFQENGDYNKPIPAQHSEHLNHMVSGGPQIAEAVKPQQWVNCQLLLCKKCNNNQTTKIKQLASFIPRDEDRYDEEIEVYKHHLEQMYKMCRPCQAAVECYIKHQNRQLRGILLNHQLQRREQDTGYVQSFAASSCTRAPVTVTVLRCLAFLSCAFLVSMAWLGSSDLFSLSIKAPRSSEAQPRNLSQADGGEPPSFLEKTLEVLPENTLESLNEAWRFGQNHQIALVAFGLLACVFAMFLAGQIRMRRVDAFSSFLWMLVMGLYLSETYFLNELPTWMDTAKLGTTALCCLVGLTSAVATRKASGPRRHRPRRYPYGERVAPFGSLNGSAVTPDLPNPLLSTPPGLLQLLTQPSSRSHRKASPSSLPGRLNRALSLGTIPSLARADSGYLFSGSRPASRASTYKDSPTSDYFSLLSGSRAASPLPSPTPSVAESAGSSSGSLHHRRPLISPARLNLQGQKLGLPSTQLDRRQTQHSLDEMCHPDSSLYPQDFPPFLIKTHIEFPDHTKLLPEAGSVSSNATHRKEKQSSHSSSTCPVDTTTSFLDPPSRWKGFARMSLSSGCMALSVTMNLVLISVCVYLVLS